MQGTEPSASSVTTGRHGNEEADNTVLMSSKPLHRFVQRNPKSLGIVIVMCGCAEVLMGFNLASEEPGTSYGIYIPFWQGVLFLVCGSLSIYTEGHPSKKMVTVCLAMYLVSFFGILVSLCYRLYCFSHINYLHYSAGWQEGIWAHHRVKQLGGVESILFISSLCVSGLLIFLTCVARLALKSTRTQIIVQCVPAAAQSNTTTN